MQKHKEYLKNNFNKKYTFETFVVGENNYFAYATAIAVSEEAGELYNVLCIYGGSGLGKTHLLQAIGNHISQTDSKKK